MAAALMAIATIVVGGRLDGRRHRFELLRALAVAVGRRIGEARSVAHVVN